MRARYLSLFLGHAQQFCLRRGAVGQPALAVFAHGAHAVMLGGDADFGFGRAVMDLGADLVGGLQQFVYANPALVAGHAALVAADRMPQRAVVAAAVRAQVLVVRW